MNEPTHCDICKVSLERGYSYRYQGDKLVSAYCFDCDNQERFNNYVKTQILTMSLVTNNSMKLFYLDMKKDWGFDKDEFLEELKHRIDIQLASSRIQKKIKEFEKEVWFNGLQDKVLASKIKGVSAHTKVSQNFCVLTYSMCGRTMITFENDVASVTCMADETSKESRTGFHGIFAKEKDALDLIQLAIDLYKNKELDFQEDTKVSMGF